MKLSLPDSVFSTQDLASLLVEVHLYARWFSHHDIMKRVSAKHATEPPVISPAATELIRDLANHKELSQQSLDELIVDLEKFRKTAPTMTITLAAPPSSDIKKNIVSWCRKNVASNVLITFQFNATILGGMVLRYGSRIFDWSFRRQILASREHFPEVLRNV